jgi:hypothetical protein
MPARERSLNGMAKHPRDLSDSRSDSTGTQLLAPLRSNDFEQLGRADHAYDDRHKFRDGL